MKRGAQRNGEVLARLGLVALLVSAACGPSDAEGGGDLPPAQPGNAYLSIVGDQNVFLDEGAQATITVKYHDKDGNPLAGEVGFELTGSAAGAALADTAGVTDAQGLVRVQVTGGTQAAFQVKATAAYAQPVQWNVAVAPNTQQQPLDATGVYQLDSQFDIATGVPGSVGTVLNAFLDMTDDPTDPATWLIDQALTQIDNGTLKSIVNTFRPALDGFLNDLLLQNSPQFVSTIVDIGDDLGQVARRFGTVTTLEVVKGDGIDGAELRGTHSLDGFKITVDGQTFEYSMAELSLGESKAENLAVTLETENKLVIADHELPVSYGHVILFALNNVIIPQIDPWATNLRELLEGLVDCYEVGYAISDYVGIGSPGTYEAACHAGLGFAAGYIEAKILEIDDAATALAIHGEAKPMDTSGDRKVDKLSNGLWEGQLKVGSTGSLLAKPNQKFSGQKMTP
jgi:hypothetical protein